jgi:hypothetical protein
LYTGNHIAAIGKNRNRYRKHAGICPGDTGLSQCCKSGKFSFGIIERT